MPAQKNQFKENLSKGERQIGCWLSMAEPYLAEVSASCGFDWLLIDGEHAPNDIRSVSQQIQAITRTSSHAVVRVPVGRDWIIKQVLDAGAQNILIPLVDSGKMAAEMVRAVRYPPNGIRGVGASAARASQFGAIPDYLQTSDLEICLLLQVENRAGLEALDDILATEGVDGVFIGPSDLAADMGYLGQPGAPEVRAAIKDALARIRAAGKAAGILAMDPAFIEDCLEMDATFLAVGIDVTVFVKAMRELAQKYKG
ncbi:MAG: HpcH/HpaI aldolase/citrate lyase family protein [Rhodobacteraceae bacterium]|nr:HpcH/HpaI aldolase/citrate lyase family protein [Paracoccaceae bacterium]